jgi:hypothetical protein
MKGAAFTDCLLRCAGFGGAVRIESVGCPKHAARNQVKVAVVFHGGVVVPDSRAEDAGLGLVHVGPCDNHVVFLLGAVFVFGDLPSKKRLLGGSYFDFSNWKWHNLPVITPENDITSSIKTKDSIFVVDPPNLHFLSFARLKWENLNCKNLSVDTYTNLKSVGDLLLLGSFESEYQLLDPKTCEFTPIKLRENGHILDFSFVDFDEASNRLIFREGGERIKNPSPSFWQSFSKHGYEKYRHQKVSFWISYDITKRTFEKIVPFKDLMFEQDRKIDLPYPNNDLRLKHYAGSTIKWGRKFIVFGGSPFNEETKSYEVINSGLIYEP